MSNVLNFKFAGINLLNYWSVQFFENRFYEVAKLTLASSVLLIELGKLCMVLLMILDGCNILLEWLLWRMAQLDFLNFYNV